MLKKDVAYHFPRRTIRYLARMSFYITRVLIFQNPCKTAIMIFFSGLFLTSASFTPKLKVGLDQYLAVPQDSYVLDYFDVSFVKDYFNP